MTLSNLSDFRMIERPHSLYCSGESDSDCEGAETTTFVQIGMLNKNKQTATALKRRHATYENCFIAREFWKSVAFEISTSKHQKKVAAKELVRVERLMKNHPQRPESQQDQLAASIVRHVFN